jgi:hypothetical protein
VFRHDGVKRERGGGGKRANEESMEYRVWSMGVDAVADGLVGLKRMSGTGRDAARV